MHRFALVLALVACQPEPAECVDTDADTDADTGADTAPPAVEVTTSCVDDETAQIVVTGAAPDELYIVDARDEDAQWLVEEHPLSGGVLELEAGVGLSAAIPGVSSVYPCSWFASGAETLSISFQVDGECFGVGPVAGYCPG